MEATFPALPASVQASMTTGAEPGKHGIVCGGLFRRESRTLSFDERSNTLLSTKRFWHRRSLPKRPCVALLNWCNSLAGAADAALGACVYDPQFSKLTGQPISLVQELVSQLDQYQPELFHGPGASWPAGVWLTSAAEQIWKKGNPDLLWVNLPGVDFEVVRHGPRSPQSFESLRVLDMLARRLAETVAETGGQTVIVSDGEYEAVHRWASPNAMLRRAGLLELVESPRGQTIDLVNSRAFALADHQIAHVFCRDTKAIERATAAIASDPAVARVLTSEEMFRDGLGRQRAGELIAISASDAWFSYRWWDDDAPDLAFRRDMHTKCGYDPCELFAGEAPGRINPNALNVRASRGRLDNPGGECLLAATCPLPVGDGMVRVTDMPRIITQLMFG